MAGDEKWKLGASFHHVCDLRNEMLGDDDDVLLTNNHVVQSDNPLSHLETPPQNRLPNKWFSTIDGLLVQT